MQNCNTILVKMMQPCVVNSYVHVVLRFIGLKRKCFVFPYPIIISFDLSLNKGKAFLLVDEYATERY